ncbi:MAG: EAL domain-containing protein [Gammaproteobacteria bacterium]|nr:EAL domain-containing protein [Gammaproteobacteria bacterium]
MIKSPVARLSFGLVMLTVSTMLFGQLLGVVPDTRSAELESRKVIAESLGVQVSSAIAVNDPEAATRTLRSVVSRNNSVISVGVRTAANELVAQAGNHAETWKVNLNDKSTATHVIVPLFKGKQRWGALEVHFGRLGTTGDRLFKGSFLSMLLFLGVFGFIAYQIFLRRALRELNPDAVIPARVRTALDTLAEGVLIVDAKEQIVFANQAFVAKTDLGHEELLGKPVNQLNWEIPDDIELPWVSLLRGDDANGSIELSLVTPVGNRYNLVVNASPISGGPGQPVRGVMATFDDITELEKANDELRHALTRLESNEKEIRRQNRELQVLATRDPLTGCLNRRSFFKGFDTLIADAKDNGTPLSCIMVDIDFFKKINDKFGHGVGDKVIRLMAEILLDSASPDDLVGRYGGEEFCVVLPGSDAEAAAVHAEKIRSTLLTGRCTPVAEMDLVTASFGVAQMGQEKIDATVLVDQADSALYTAKENGRNRVEVLNNEGACVIAPQAPASTTPKRVKGPDKDYVATLEVRIDELETALSLGTSDGVLERVTGMPGRQLLLDRTTQAIERAKRYRHHVVAIALRLDALPRVRDALGEMAAEKFRETALGIIKKTLRASDSIGVLQSKALPHSVARLDSEQIGLLLTDIEDIEQVPRIINRMQESLAVPQEIAGNEISLTADLGISVYPEDSLDAVTLLRHASAAMNAVTRDAGSERFRYYATEINTMSKRRLRLETNLHRAIEKGEFDVHYQPKVCMHSGKIVGMEALLRWNNPRSGTIPPDEFIPVAEQIGCMNAISQQTIKHVCKQIAAWSQAGLGDIPVAINLSPVEFHDAKLATRILSIVHEVGIDPALLEFEITESVVMENARAAADIMNTLSEAGATIAIDDFGTGYATLQCLTQFPVSVIKIDRSFMNGLLDNPQDAAVVNGVTSLAHTMGLSVVAEGVETVEQVDYLRDLQCDILQGYYLSRPVAADAARELLSNPIRIQSLVDGTRKNKILRPDAAGAQFLGLLNNTAAAEVD